MGGGRLSKNGWRNPRKNAATETEKCGCLRRFLLERNYATFDKKRSPLDFVAFSLLRFSLLVSADVLSRLDLAVNRVRSRAVGTQQLLMQA